MNPALQSLEEWGNSLCPQCVQKVKQSISAASLVKRRDGFGQTVRPVPGSVLASTATDLSGGEPDYFFHWLRDSAIVMNAMRLMATIDENLEAWIIAAFDDFAKFSLKLRSISGREFLNSHGLPAKVAPELRQYLRPDSEIRTVEGMRVLGEARYNADGTLDFIRWSRPQHDGPALRALAAMRFADGGFSLSGGLEQRLASLIRFDLDYTVLNAGEPCFDIWEEEPARHYYTTLVQYAALQMGAKWAHRREEQEYASYLQALTLELYKLLGKFWSDRQGIYRSRIPSTGEDTPKDLDFSVILGVIHAGLEDGAHSILDERVHHTLRQLETLFAREYAINRGPGPGLAYGRY
ncbi:MAG TPA: glycoside hydrolase family 15 protein, partial [Hyphomicrobiales bacterium]|nr:glycoside hydrolase family 15 protein [Hyphomicrobiales bacterium]